MAPLLVILGTIGLFAYGTIALISEDALWFLGRAEVPPPERIVIRVEGEETVLKAPSPDYDAMFDALKRAMSAFDNMSPRSSGLSAFTLAEYEQKGVILEFYFDEPVDFHLPFGDGNPMALLIPIEGRFGGEGFVFRGKHGNWWAGQMVMSDEQPLLDALSTLGYMQP